MFNGWLLIMKKRTKILFFFVYVLLGMVGKTALILNFLFCKSYIFKCEVNCDYELIHTKRKLVDYEKKGLVFMIMRLN